MSDAPTVEERIAALERLVVEVGAQLLPLAHRILAIEAQLAIQTGTVFGAQGDSEPMTIQHIDERCRVTTRDDIVRRASAMLGVPCEVSVDDKGLGPELTLRHNAIKCNVVLSGVASDYTRLVLLESIDFIADRFLAPMIADMRRRIPATERRLP